MLLYVIEKNMIINLNNIRTIKLDRDYIPLFRLLDLMGNFLRFVGVITII